MGSAFSIEDDQTDPTVEQWDELSNLVKKGDVAIRSGLVHINACSQLDKAVIAEQCRQLRDALMHLDGLVNSARTSCWFRVKDGGFSMEGMPDRMTELSDHILKADALSKMVKSLVASCKS